MDNEYLDISCYIGSDDYNMFVDIVNQGIDSRLTAFCKSNFDHIDNRLYMYFHKDEIEILLRRLSETDDCNAYGWENDIVQCWYGFTVE